MTHPASSFQLPASNFQPPVRVMYIIWSLGLGGAEQVTIRLASGLDRRRFEPLIVCLNEPGPFAHQAMQASVEVIALHKQGPFDLRVLVRLRRLMRERQIDVVHTQLWGANLWGRLAARLAGVPTVIATEQNVDTWKRSYHFILDRVLARWTTELIAVSDNVRAFYESHHVGNGRWRVIYNAVDTSRVKPRKRGIVYTQLGIGPNEPVVGLIGRLVPAKAPQDFVEAIAQASRTISSLKALVIGDGPLRRDVAAQVKRLGLEERVVFTGLREDVPELLAGMDVLVFTSEREGSSLAMLEAMAAGVPVIATAVGGTPELIESGISGRLVSPHRPQEVAEHIVDLLRHSARAEAIRVAARQRVEQQFSLERMVKENEHLYETLAEQSLLRSRVCASPRPVPPAPCPTRIAYVIDHLGTGGAQQQLRWLLTHLDRERFAPTVMSLSGESTELLQAIRELGIEVITIPQRGAVDLRAFWRVYRVLRRGYFQIVQTCLFTADLYGRVAAWLTGVPIRISSVRSIETDKPRHYVWADRMLAPITQHFIANADCVGAMLRKRERIAPEKIRRIYNGIPINGALPRRAGTSDIVIGSVGRLDQVKGYDVLLRAFARASQAQAHLRLLVVGDGPERAALEALANTLGIESSVEFAGYQPNVEPWLQRMDCFVLSSRYEGCSNALLEAMAAGRPVVVTSVGGNVELVEDGVSGLLVPPDDEEALAQALLRLCRDGGAAERMARTARARIQERFDIPRMVEETRELYEELLEGLHIRSGGSS